jgi:uncharacterized membrane protein YbjE (DUF340 family)
VVVSGRGVLAALARGAFSAALLGLGFAGDCAASAGFGWYRA